MKKLLYLLILTTSCAFAQENLGYQRPPEEIAKLLKINVGTSKSNLFKARTFLAKLIAKSKFYIFF